MSRETTRRSWIAGGASGVLGAFVAAGSASAASATEPDVIRSVSDFGAAGDGHDDTDALRRAMDWANAEAVPRAVLFPPGIYAVDELRVPAQVRLIGVGGGLSRYPRAGAYGGVSIVPTVGTASTAPLVTLVGPATPGGAVLDGLVVDGRNFRTPGATMDRSSWAARTGIAVEGGFEAQLRDVRVIRFRGVGIDVLSLNNARWDTVFVDLCGTDTLPAMRIGSPMDGATNFAVFDSLTIERSGNTALAIGAGDDLTQDWASNLTFVGIHVESTLDTPGAELNRGPLVDIGNVRALTFLAPQLVGAPAPMLRYAQRAPAGATVASGPGGDVRDQQGGVMIVGGQFHQHSGSAVRTAAILVTGSGRGFNATGVRFAYCVAPGVVIDESFAFDAVVLGCSFRTQNGVERVVDNRTDDVALRYWATTAAGDFSVTRDLDVARDVIVERTLELGTSVRVPGGVAGTTAPTVTPPDATIGSGGWAELSKRGPGTDLLGEVWWRLSTKASKRLVRVTFSEPKPNAPAVFLMPRKPGTALLALYVELEQTAAGCTGFVICSAEPCAPGPDTHIVEYVVIDRR
ncbi:glycosyl hydrolase family 28-related protein [Curtobacterium sp. 22159]|uniref:glycosyl hydrolase family 28-related protein n=1 Tax=Curtobacterium sp. 22159 TaxID=3453882 RepID=UPI003F834718